MKPETAQQIDAYIAEVKINGASGTERAFNVNPTVAQNIELKTQESSHFLSLINIVQVERTGRREDRRRGGKPALAYRTASGPRTPVDPIAMDSSGYFCRQTNFDTQITYRRWTSGPSSRTFSDWYAMRSLGRWRDRIMIGWNGTSAAATTNRAANPCCRT
jgi:hypothetical protein